MMKGKKRIALAAMVVLLIVAVIVFALSGGRQAQPRQGNLLTNADFSAQENGMPKDWNPGMWVTSAGASFLSAVTLEDGTTAVLIENAALNDARFEQVVPVRENASYRLSARVRAEGCAEDRVGANLSFIGIYGTSDCVYDTDGEWKTLTLYARTGKGQKDATVGVRLGGYGSEATGKAWFTDVELCEVESIPTDATVLDIATPAPQKEKSRKVDSALAPVVRVFAACIVALCVLVVCVGLMRGNGNAESGKVLFAFMLLIALAMRLLFAATIEGYGVDMGCYSAWAYRMASGGPANFYAADYFCDYPPAYLYVLGLIGSLANVLGINLSVLPGQALLKLPQILCDILLTFILYRAADREEDRKPALVFAALLAFEPAFVMTGAAWGQIDSILALLLVVMLLEAKRGRWQTAIPVFALAVLTKPQAGLLVPLGIACLVRECLRRDGKTINNIGVGLLAGVVVTAIVVIPFSVHQENPLWLVDLYLETLSSYDYATLSTGNLMFLLGGNWVKNSEAVLGAVTYGQLGMVLMLLSFVAGIVVYFRGKERGRLFLAGSLTMQLVFVLGSKMHERYILPALALLMLAYLETDDMLLMASAVLSGVASAMNIGIVLAFDYLIAPNLGWGYAIAVMQLLAATMTLVCAVRLSLGREPLKMPEPKPGRSDETAGEEIVYAADIRLRRELLAPQDAGLHMKPLDWALMLGLTAVYACIGFWQLGAMKAPQTGYISTMQGENVILDLGAQRENFHIYYYGGISDTQFSFMVSDDNMSYGDPCDAFFDRGECFKWQAVRSVSHDEDGVVTGATGGMYNFSGRYICVTFKDAGSALWEVAAVDDVGNVLPLTVTAATGALEGHEADPASLIDEQDTVPEKPSYLNSMYFDEIYHARTGYEHANSLYTYETTHPPLGKVLMGLCIKIWGMTPFAWRFAGALVGVLMIPAIYLLAKQLMGSTLWAFFSAFLLAFDCMHFTQTRIATIDSFPVLFIILAFLFMARWMKMSFFHVKLGKTFVPLALSGLFMGLAIASKWIGCYAAVGLAVLFFARMTTLWKQSCFAAAHREEGTEYAHAARRFWEYAMKTCAACVVFFVIVPLVVYILSYIPYLSAYGEVKWNLRTFQRIWDAQTLMFDYHKNLVAEHYFASPWYEWPIIAKPMWYYSADYKAAGMASSILAFGNPAVWWTGLVGMIFALAASVYHNALPALRMTVGRDDEYDRALPVIVVGFLSAYLPWVLVSRLTFIYHYFASVPFIILATAQGLRYIERRNKRLAWATAAALCVAALVLFVGFYPLASGMEVPRAWCDMMAWFKNWMWY